MYGERYGGLTIWKKCGLKRFWTRKEWSIIVYAAYVPWTVTVASFCGCACELICLVLAGFTERFKGELVDWTEKGVQILRSL